MRPEPTTREALAYFGMKVAEYASYVILATCIAYGWIITP